MFKRKLSKLDLMMEVLQFRCPKRFCKSDDTEVVDSMTTNMSFTTAERRRCKKCGYEWVRYYKAK